MVLPSWEEETPNKFLRTQEDSVIPPFTIKRIPVIHSQPVLNDFIAEPILFRIDWVKWVLVHLAYRSNYHVLRK